MWEDLQQFYTTCTDVSEPTEIELVVQRPTEWDDAAKLIPVVERAHQHFGAPTSENLVGHVMWPSGEERPGGRYTWTRTKDQIGDDLAYLIHGEPWPKAAIGGPVTLRMHQRFCWKPSSALPSLRTDHPRQTEMGGGFSIWMQRNCFVQPDLTFPFVHDDPAFLDFLSELRVHLPFRMHSKHFRRIIPGKKPGTFQARKMPWPVVLT